VIGDVYAGRIEAMASKWGELYENPGAASATCRRCGSAVNNLTQHEGFHAKLNVMYGACGLPIYATVV
jgi:hypothetical protein